MRNFIISIIGVFMVFSVFAAGENIPTSKSYVDSALVPKQDIIEGTNDAPQVLTNTGTAGEYGTKDIYDSTASYATQTDALIDAVTMNTAVQNAIDSEFVCVSWVNDDPNEDCLLMDVRGEPTQSILPTGYTALEYIESTGTQIIDTGVKGLNTGDWEIYVKWMITGQGGNDYPYVLSTGYEAETYNVYRIILRRGYTDRYIVNGNSKAGGGSQGINNQPMNSIYTATIKNGSVVFNGTTYETPIQGNSISANRSICMFGNCIVMPGTRMAGRIYESWAKKDGVFMYNVVPARHDSDGKLGMYDLVSRTFFTNAGTGEFIAGPVANLYLPSGN